MWYTTKAHGNSTQQKYIIMITYALDCSHANIQQKKIVYIMSSYIYIRQHNIQTNIEYEIIFLWIGITNMQKLFSSLRSLAFCCSFFLPRTPSPIRFINSINSIKCYFCHTFGSINIFASKTTNSKKLNMMLLVMLRMYVCWLELHLCDGLTSFSISPIKWENTICLIENWTTTDRIIWCYVSIWFDFLHFAVRIINHV